MMERRSDETVHLAPHQKLNPISSAQNLTPSPAQLNLMRLADRFYVGQLGA
ncbi:hypothetical protein C8N45_105153 [Yoonia sediminilitoris]|uniref:Uncharacterized protein n=1 Tax=Yoonia sediminilitoris TaxID=1286148 RepID=A0A2T6KHD3_9RHOB|nr:hypothetical protein C8N45_105153 [Yoonia sediminilitoris]